jgi:dTMP kinase
MAKKSLRKGIFITFEGIEGCGKTTQSRLLFEYLKKCSYASFYTREPGGTRAGELIRKVLLHSGVKISDITETFLFEAARAQIVSELIAPNLARKRIVVCDRFADATRSYQGYGGGVKLAVIEALNKAATGGLEADLTIVIDTDPAVGLKRARKKGKDRMEAKELSYHRRVRAGYLKLAKKYKKRIRVIKMQDTIAATQALVRREAEIVIQKYKRTG